MVPPLSPSRVGSLHLLSTHTPSTATQHPATVSLENTIIHPRVGVVAFA